MFNTRRKRSQIASTLHQKEVCIMDFVDPSEHPVCQFCNGSGEGLHDGSVCSVCKGRGELPSENDLNALELAKELKLERDITRWEERKYGIR